MPPADPHFVGKSDSGLWLARLESRVSPRRVKGGASPFLGILTALPQEYWLLSWNKVSELLVTGNGL